MAAKKKKKAKKTSKTAVAKAPAKARRPIPKPRAKPAAETGLHALIGRAVADQKFLNLLLESPARAMAPFKLDRAARQEVLSVLSNPALVREQVSHLRTGLGRETVEAV